MSSWARSRGAGNRTASSPSASRWSCSSTRLALSASTNPCAQTPAIQVLGLVTLNYSSRTPSPRRLRRLLVCEPCGLRCRPRFVTEDELTEDESTARTHVHAIGVDPRRSRFAPATVAERLQSPYP